MTASEVKRGGGGGRVILWSVKTYRMLPRWSFYVVCLQYQEFDVVVGQKLLEMKKIVRHKQPVLC